MNICHESTEIMIMEKVAAGPFRIRSVTRRGTSSQILLPFGQSHACCLTPVSLYAKLSGYQLQLHIYYRDVREVSLLSSKEC